MNKEFPKYVAVNETNLLYAIQKGMHPMQEWYDREHQNIPFFWNYVTGPGYGNGHHRSFSCAHIPGRWLNALVNAEEITKTKVPDETYERLRYWALAVFENETGMMANLNLHTFQWEKVCDLHNLREVMYAFTALLKRNPNDYEIRQRAERLIDSVDRYVDYETGAWKTELYEMERGGRVECGACDEEEVYRFAVTIGRYIDGLVKFYRVYPLEKALRQAFRLTDAALRTVLLEGGDFDADRFARHLHSTSSMLAGIAGLGNLSGDYLLMERILQFMENGFHKVALDFGWCLENDTREDLVGEINNTGDYVEVCLFLGAAGYDAYYDRADRMLRCHLLPAQLLDVSFLPDEEDADGSRNRMASRMEGAFGFPCPYGHEYAPGSVISFNWDIVGGGVSSLCQAYRHIITDINGILSINLQFDYEDTRICYHNPYQSGNMEIFLKERRSVRVLLPADTKWEELKEELEKQKIGFSIRGVWLYLYGIYERGGCSVPVNFAVKRRTYSFRGHDFIAEYAGNRIVCMSSAGKRLCFFKEIEEASANKYD